MGEKASLLVDRSRSTCLALRRWVLSSLLFGLLVASLTSAGVVRSHLPSAHAATNPAKYAFVVLIDGGHPEPVLPPQITEARNVGRACTLFQAAKKKGLSTAFISKYPAYEILNGPNTCPIYRKPGLDNLQTPNFATFSGTTQDYDLANFNSVRAQIASPTRPNLFGLYALAPNYAMKSYGINSPEVASAIQFEDSQIALTVALLKSVGIYNQTEIVITNDHGNTALKQAIPDHGPGSIDQYLNDNGIPTAQTTTDRVALVWLQDSSQAQAAIDLLSTPENMTQFGIQDITPASGLGDYLVKPQNRTPDFIVWPTDGSNGSQAVVYGSVPLSKQVEHGGRGDADQNILMLLEGPGIPVGYTSSQHVWLMQLASTVATTMCLSLPTATLPALPGTSAPENCQNYRKRKMPMKRYLGQQKWKRYSSSRAAANR